MLCLSSALRGLTWDFTQLMSNQQSRLKRRLVQQAKAQLRPDVSSSYCYYTTHSTCSGYKARKTQTAQREDWKYLQGGLYTQHKRFEEGQGRAIKSTETRISYLTIDRPIYHFSELIFNSHEHHQATNRSVVAFTQTSKSLKGGWGL